MKNSALQQSKKRKAELAAAGIAFFGALCYLIRTLYHLTNYIIQIPTGEIILYSIVPTILCFELGFVLLKNTHSRSRLSILPVCTFLFYIGGLMFMPEGSTASAAGSHGNSTIVTQADGSALGGNLVFAAVLLTFAVLYVLVCLDKMKTKVPALVISVLGSVLTTFLIFGNLLVFQMQQMSFIENYGYITATVGCAMFFIAITVELFAFGPASSVSKECQENEADDIG